MSVSFRLELSIRNLCNDFGYEAYHSRNKVREEHDKECDKYHCNDRADRDKEVLAHGVAVCCHNSEEDKEAHPYERDRLEKRCDSNLVKRENVRKERCGDAKNYHRNKCVCGCDENILEIAFAIEEDERRDAFHGELFLHLVENGVLEANGTPGHGGIIFLVFLLIIIHRAEDHFEGLSSSSQLIVHFDQARSEALARSTPMSREIQAINGIVQDGVTHRFSTLHKRRSDPFARSGLLPRESFRIGLHVIASIGVDHSFGRQHDKARNTRDFEEGIQVLAHFFVLERNGKPGHGGKVFFKSLCVLISRTENHLERNILLFQIQVNLS